MVKDETITNDEYSQVKLCIQLLRSVLHTLYYKRSLAKVRTMTTSWGMGNIHVCVELTHARERLGRQCSPYGRQLLYQAAERLHGFINGQIGPHNSLYLWTWHNRPEEFTRRPTYAEVNDLRILWVRDMIRRYRDLIR